jgi:glycosyltransferase involved in cell wall biosynthesis
MGKTEKSSETFGSTRQREPDSVSLPVSAVIPLYNKGRHVERSIASILAQTLPAREIIVVDDGSTDDGPERVREIARSEAKVSLIRQPNRGPGAARNTGLAAATGKYVSFLDADDTWLPAYLETAVSMLEDPSANVTIVWTGFLASTGVGMRARDVDGIGGVYEIRPGAELSMVNRIMRFICTCSAVMRTDVVRKWGGFFDAYKCLLGEDKYLFMKLLFNERFGIIDQPLVVYHTDASELWGNGNLGSSALTLEPFLEQPDRIIEACPLDTRHILRRHLLSWALNKSETYAKLGHKREAVALLDRFVNKDYPHTRRVAWVRLLTRLSPILPWLRKLRHLAG